MAISSPGALGAVPRASAPPNGADHGGRMRFAFLAETSRCLTVESAPGQGSTFTVLLPYSLSPEASTEGGGARSMLRERRARRRAGAP